MDWKTPLMPLVRLYWRIFQPRTFGVKALIFHPDGKRVLLVLHSYGNRQLWNLPGGGYNPKHEDPKEAAKREVSEDLGVSLLDVKDLCLYQTDSEGKRDTVNVVTGRVASEDLSLGREISKIQWREPEAILVDGNVARVARYALRYL